MSEKRIDQSHDIFEMVRALCLQQTVDYVAGVEERLCHFFAFITETKSPRLKKV